MTRPTAGTGRGQRHVSIGENLGGHQPTDGQNRPPEPASPAAHDVAGIGKAVCVREMYARVEACLSAEAVDIQSPVSSTLSHHSQ
jgi:hypothetical protein